MPRAYRLSRSPFAPEVTKFGVWRPTTNSQKTAIGGHFWPCRRQNLNAPDWLAGAGGFEPPYGGIKIHCLTTWRRPNRLFGKRRPASRRFLWQRRSIEGVGP